GGQKQRVAVGRALVRDPIVFLFDEPLSNLDAKLRTQMRSEIVDLHDRTGRTFVYVTHDQAEAMSMSDRIAIIHDGRILQVATPRELFERPASTYVAAFLGDRPINMIELSVDGARLSPPFEGFATDAMELPERIIIGVRPETLEIVPNGPLSGRVDVIEYFGSEAIVSIRLADGQILRAALNATEGLPSVGDTISLGIGQGIVHVFDAVSGRRLGALPASGDLSEHPAKYRRSS
ncbi:MAG: ABC transporter ATP-binding protein, partial [Hyphomicrobiales bacterium]